MRIFVTVLMTISACAGSAQIVDAQFDCATEEVAAVERGDAEWLVRHLVVRHQVDLLEAEEFVGDYLREARYLRDIGEAARHQAEKDMAEGHCDYLRYGGPPRSIGDEFDCQLRKQGLQPVGMAACLVSKEDRAFCSAYDAYVAEVYRSRYGVDPLESRQFIRKDGARCDHHL